MNTPERDQAIAAVREQARDLADNFTTQAEKVGVEQATADLGAYLAEKGPIASASIGAAALRLLSEQTNR